MKDMLKTILTAEEYQENIKEYHAEIVALENELKRITQPFLTMEQIHANASRRAALMGLIAVAVRLAFDNGFTVEIK